MLTPQIEVFIQKAKKAGLTNEQIKQKMRDSGWSDDQIDTVFKEMIPNDDLIAPPPPAKDSRSSSDKKPVSEPTKASGSMWDAFEHILMFISLYVMATSIALILHHFVNVWVPAIGDGAATYEGYNYRDPYANSWEQTLLRGYLAALIVSYPLFAFFFLRITKRTLSNPAIRYLKSRKFLIYLTLVIAFLIVVGNIITIIFSFLNGNVTFNFALHFLVTLVVSGSVFGYYLYQVKEDRHYANL